MRTYKVTFVSGLAAGYVLGTRAGRERYDRLRKFVRSASDNPAVQQAAGVLQAQAAGTMKSAWNLTTAGCRNGVALIRKRDRSSAKPAFTGHATSGNGSAPRAAKEDQRPFVPVNGNFGDHAPS
jgi:hypothetical protein